MTVAPAHTDPTFPAVLRTLPPERLEGFDAVLRAHLDERLYRFFSLRFNAARLAEALALATGPAAPAAGAVLDLGAGPCVLDFLLEHLGPWDPVALDRWPAFGAVYTDLVGKGFLRRTRFVVADVREVEFRPGSFSWILAHDVFYEPGLDVGTLLARLAAWLRPGGTLYFDVWDRRAAWLWRLTGQDRGFTRYHLRTLRQRLQREGFEVMCEKPYFGSRRLGAVARRALWTCCRLSNTRHFLVRRAGGAA